MPISQKHKVIFVHIPKTAGSSICDWLDIEQSPQNLFRNGYLENESFALQHLPISEIKTRIQSKQWQNYFKFTVVRNPIDRLISTFKWRKGIFPRWKNSTFPEFVDNLYRIFLENGWDKFSESDIFIYLHGAHLLPQ